MRRTVYTGTWIGLSASVIAALGPGLSAFSVVTVPVGINPSALAVNPQTGEINVADSGSNDVSVVDEFTFKVSTVPAGSLPAEIAINPVTGFAYVANSRNNTVTAIYGYGEGKKRKTYATGAGPGALAVNATTNRVYVVNNPDGTVTVIDEVAGTTATVPVGTRPWSIAVNETTNRIYVTNIWDNSVTVIDGSTNSAVATVPVGAGPYNVAVNPITNQIYVANNGDGGTTVTVIDGATNGTVDVAVGRQPAYLAVNRVTNKVYVGGGQLNGDIAVIDGATLATTHIFIPFGPWGFAQVVAFAVNEVTNMVYLVDTMQTNLLVIDGNTNEVTLRPLQFYPSSVTVDPASNRVYVSHISNGCISVISE
jgi:YVTN family beta-propeller protein